MYIYYCGTQLTSNFFSHTVILFWQHLRIGIQQFIRPRNRQLLHQVEPTKLMAVFLHNLPLNLWIYDLLFFNIPCIVGQSFGVAVPPLHCEGHLVSIIFCFERLLFIYFPSPFVFIVAFDQSGHVRHGTVTWQLFLLKRLYNFDPDHLMGKRLSNKLNPGIHCYIAWSRKPNNFLSLSGGAMLLDTINSRYVHHFSELFRNIFF